MLGVEAAGVDVGPVRYLPASQAPAIDLTVPRTIHEGDGGLLWHVFSTYPDATWNHRVTITGKAVVTILTPPEDVLYVVGREPYDPPASTWGNGAWLFAQDSRALVPLDEPVYGFTHVGESLVRVGDAPLGNGTLRAPSGAEILREDTLGLVGLLETGTWTFEIDAGHYAILPAQFVGVETPDELWA